MEKMMTKKMYRLWMELLKSPGRWQDIHVLAKKLNITANQVSALISHIDNTFIDRDGDDVLFTGTDDDAWNMRRKVTKECFGFTDDELDCVLNSLSTVGALSVTDICNETGMSMTNVMIVLKTVPNLGVVSGGSVKLYYIQTE